MRNHKLQTFTILIFFISQFSQLFALQQPKNNPPTPILGFETPLDKARFHFNAENYGEAESLLNDITQGQNPSASSYYLLGLTYQMTNRHFKALSSFQEASKLTPQTREIFFRMAESHMALEQFELAIKEWDNYLTLDYGGETETLFFQMKEGAYSLASAESQENYARLQIGIASLKSGLYVKAKKYLEEAKQSVEYQSDVFFWLGKLKEEKNSDLAGALANWKKAYAIDPSNQLAWEELKLYLYTLPEDQQASFLEELVSLGSNASVFEEMAYFYFNEALYEKAMLLYDSAIQLGNRHPSTFYNFGICAYESEKLDKAIFAFQEALKIDATNSLYWFMTGSTYLKKKDYFMARQYLDYALEVSPEYGKAYFNRGLTFFCLKEYEKACDDMRKALSLDVSQALNFLEKVCD